MNVRIWGGYPTKYSFDVHRDQVDQWPNIHLVYARIRRIADQIFIRCMQGSGRLLTKYSFGECRDPADYSLNIQLVYAGVRWITDRIFIWCMQGSGRFPTEYSVGVEGSSGFSDWIFIQCMNGSGRLPTEYSVGVCRDPADNWSDIHLVHAQADYQLDIHWLH